MLILVWAVHFIRTEALWSALFWSAVAVRVVLELSNSARQPHGDRVVSDRTRASLGGVFLLTAVIGFEVAFRVSSLAMPGSGRAYIVTGVTLMWLGMALRQWSVHTLGRFFTFQLTVRTGQRVVDRGPYRVVRHPSYSGMLLASLGAAVALANWLSLFILTVPYVAATVRRIGIEEQMLREGLGADYDSFAATRKRLVPGVW